MRRLLLSILLCAGCGGGEGPDPCADAPTYTNDVAAITAEHCLSCHASDLQGPARSGAPTDLNWDDYEAIEPDVARFADAITSGRMPPMPNPPVPAEQRMLVDEWRACGFPR